MKRLLSILLIALLPCMAAGNDLSVIYEDSIVPADSADERTDTVFTKWHDIRGWNTIQFWTSIASYRTASDTNFVDDSFWVNIQTSFDRVNVKTHLLDTFLTNGTSWSPYELLVSDSIFGNWMRGMLIHWDSIDVGDADSALVNRSSPFTKKIGVWYAPKN